MKPSRRTIYKSNKVLLTYDSYFIAGYSLDSLVRADIYIYIYFVMSKTSF